MGPQHPRLGLHRLDAAAHGHVAPSVEELPRPGGRDVGPEVVEVLLEEVRACGPQVQPKEAAEPSGRQLALKPYRKGAVVTASCPSGCGQAPQAVTLSAQTSTACPRRPWATLSAGASSTPILAQNQTAAVLSLSMVAASRATSTAVPAACEGGGRAGGGNSGERPSAAHPPPVISPTDLPGHGVLSSTRVGPSSGLQTPYSRLGTCSFDSALAVAASSVPYPVQSGVQESGACFGSNNGWVHSSGARTAGCGSFVRRSSVRRCSLRIAAATATRAGRRMTPPRAKP